jgi:cell division protein FtsB
MKIQENNRSVGQSVLSIAVVIMLGGAFFITARAVWNMEIKYNLMYSALNEKEEALASMRARYAFLERELKDLSTHEGIEAELRRKFSIAKQGEEPIVLIEDKEPLQESAEKKNNGSWLQYIIGVINPFN